VFLKKEELVLHILEERRICFSCSLIKIKSFFMFLNNKEHVLGEAKYFFPKQGVAIDI
jgi:hypothetical protein